MPPSGFGCDGFLSDISINSSGCSMLNEPDILHGDRSDRCSINADVLTTGLLLRQYYNDA